MAVHLVWLLRYFDHRKRDAFIIRVTAFSFHYLTPFHRLIYSIRITQSSRRPWVPDAECQVVSLDSDHRVPSEIASSGIEYFLEIHVEKEILEALKVNANLDRKTKLFIHYAENDEYPD